MHRHSGAAGGLAADVRQPGRLARPAGHWAGEPHAHGWVAARREGGGGGGGGLRQRQQAGAGVCCGGGERTHRLCGAQHSSGMGTERAGGPVQECLHVLRARCSAAQGSVTLARRSPLAPALPTCIPPPAPPAVDHRVATHKGERRRVEAMGNTIAPIDFSGSGAPRPPPSPPSLSCRPPHTRRTCRRTCPQPCPWVPGSRAGRPLPGLQQLRARGRQKGSARSVAARRLPPPPDAPPPHRPCLCRPREPGGQRRRPAAHLARRAVPVARHWRL